ncbi:hypothetical protein K491DRAFT_291837 [Lophiostoma macrostomum CBS 122681]|uniref:Uncharacterized protein n=1 Tax=Lophiostoma macrostomum CBS 122681 TaxID=1314788 RepID=A0A6A6SJE4_9PLEO|nr:hypothetical protein K491DRAFT_291837 [Lophiostoma macrostomum CBS 122681]
MAPRMRPPICTASVAASAVTVPPLCRGSVVGKRASHAWSMTPRSRCALNHEYECHGRDVEASCSLSLQAIRPSCARIGWRQTPPGRLRQKSPFQTRNQGGVSHNKNI